MSKFTERLTELIKTGNAYAVSGFLTERTYAIRDLVVAADMLSDTLTGGFCKCTRCGWQEDTTDIDFAEDLRQALAKLEEA